MLSNRGKRTKLAFWKQLQPSGKPWENTWASEAVRGSGGTAKLVLLPFEDHGYRAKESIEHVLWEQLNWFDKYVKNRKVTKETK